MVPIAVRNGIRGGWGANFQNGKNAMEKEKSEKKCNRNGKRWNRIFQLLFFEKFPGTSRLGI